MRLRPVMSAIDTTHTSSPRQSVCCAERMAQMVAPVAERSGVPTFKPNEAMFDQALAHPPRGAVLRLGLLAGVLAVSALVYFSALRMAGLKWRALMRI